MRAWEEAFSPPESLALVVVTDDRRPLGPQLSGACPQPVNDLASLRRS